ncbi:MAG: TA system VapC family ribonuclease toxin [Pyrinomonadaceae bacterium]
MLYLPDANILIYAKMSGMDEHFAAFDWLEATLADPNSTVLLCETVILAFLRITTNSKVFAPPLGSDQAGNFVSGLLDHPTVQFFRPSAEHFSEVAGSMKKYKFHGNLTMDAHLAAVALTTGATLVTRDSDFEKISYLSTLDPTAN